VTPNTLTASIAIVLAVAAPAAAQQPGWHSVIEASASTFFGASSQTLTALTTALSHSSNAFTADATMKFRYGESEDASRNNFVSSRAWAVTSSVDIRPNARFSPFVFAGAEASLEKAIAGRQSGGTGAKWLFAKTNTGTASASVAVLGERTTPLSDTARSTSLVRWSWRVKMDQRVGERLSITHVTFYGPVFNSPAQFTITSTSVGSFAVNKTLSVALTFNDNYDSQARARGAPTYNDGSLLFGVRAAF
jgi:opacity protein-like surface antigen